MSDLSRQETLFQSGKLTDGYNFFGSHLLNSGVEFCVWAPRAKSVAVVGDFNNWVTTTDIMVNNGGVWRLQIPAAKQWDAYKYFITTHDGRTFYKSDPYAFHSQTKENTASKIYDITALAWSDTAWFNRKVDNACNTALSIYEAHIGSWRRYADGNYFDYKKFADEIVPYLLELNFTHLELMGIAEYPFDGSWGYQVTGYFAPTSRYGTPDDFAYLVNKLHNAGLGLIMDWVPGHFPKDACGLYEFDGAPLYEPEDELKKEHKEWGTRCFDYGRGEVQSFLISNAMYWFDIFHVDGLRVDAVASMLYLDYGRQQWRPNKHGGNENLEAIEFFKNLNKEVLTAFPQALMIAEESTAWANVTKPPEVGGLGFNFKWNMGWMNDSLDYAKTDPLFRRGKHNKLTFSLTYCYSENYILPISHDEVVHGKGSLLNKMPGGLDQKLAGWRNYLMNMYAHPGKKLIFMGTEFAQFAEWNFASELDWGILEYTHHNEARNFFAKLNHTYCNTKALYQIDDDWAGFEWLVADDCNQNVYIFQRIARDGSKLICIFNYSPVRYDNYRFGADSGTYTQVLSSDISGYSVGGKKHKALNVESHNKKTSIVMDILPMSGVYMFSKGNAGVGGAMAHSQCIGEGSGSVSRTLNGGKAIKSKPNNKKPKSETNSKKPKREIGNL